MKKNEKRTPANEKYVKEIITDYNVLSKGCNEVKVTKDSNGIKISDDGNEIRNIVLCLKNTMRAYDDMYGLSANQIGFDKRIICLKFSNGIISLINPLVTACSDVTIPSREICHSLPGKEFLRKRHYSVTVSYTNPLGQYQTRKFEGFAACVLQHHLEHLDGHLVCDIGLELDEEFDKATDEEREEVWQMYCDSLDLWSEQLNEEIEKDAELKKLRDAALFMSKVDRGEVQIESVPLDDEEIEHIKKLEDEYEEYKKKLSDE